MRMLVLAGGFGTRLHKVVSHVPKPLAPVGSVPFLHYQVENWIDQGVRSFVFLLHYGATEIEKFIDDRRDSLFSECLVKSVTEPEPLGTGGAVAYAVDRLRLAGPQLIVNADTWIGSGVPELIENRTDSLAIVWQSNVSRYGRVKVDNSGFISAFCEKSNCLEPGWINGGLCLLRAEHFSGWNGKPLSLETEVFPRIISTSRLKAVPLKTDFIDIGVPRDYLRFCRWQSRGRGGGM